MLSRANISEMGPSSGVATATSHPSSFNQRTRWTSWIGAPLNVVSCETKRTRGGVTGPRSWARSGILRLPQRDRLRNQFRDVLAEFLAEAFHREALFVGLARLFSQ